MRFRKLSVTALISCLAGLCNVGTTQERPVRKQDLPSAVQKTADEQSKSATVRGYSVEMEKGRKVYEVELRVNNHTKDLLIDSQGNLLEVEEEKAIESLPADVRKGLHAVAGTGEIMKVESITKGDRLVAYEAVVRHGKRRSEIQVGPHGERLARKE
jgi:hypothetical protein